MVIRSIVRGDGKGRFKRMARAEIRSLVRSIDWREGMDIPFLLVSGGESSRRQPG